MRSSRQIFLLVAFLVLCGTALSQATKQLGPRESAVYQLTFSWPTVDYWGTKYTKKDYPCFNGDNFALRTFFPIANGLACQASTCPHQPLNIGKIQESDYKYLDKYFKGFGQDAHKTTKDLWNTEGSCYKDTQTSFFSKMVQVHKKYNVMNALAAKGIVPSKTKTYTSDQIVDALAVIFNGYKPRISCSIPKYNEKTGKYDLPVFYEFAIYLDSKLNLTEEHQGFCAYQGCSNVFMFPPLEF